MPKRDLRPLPAAIGETPLVLALASLSTFETVFGAILTAVGIVFAILGLILAWASARMPGGERAEGRIVGFDVAEAAGLGFPSTGGGDAAAQGEPARRSVSGRIHRPRVAFTTTEGSAVTATARFAVNPRRGRIGDVVTVFYDPADPQLVRVRTARALGSCMEAAFVLFGLALAAMGIVILTSG